MSAEPNRIDPAQRKDEKTRGDGEPTKSILPHETLGMWDVSSLPRKVLVGKDERYELRKEIGRGGYGVVYLAYDSQLSRQVAIKIARPEMVADLEGIERFRKESRAAAMLDHPGIIPVFDCGEDDHVHYYVMPYLDCDNLAKWFAKQSGPARGTGCSPVDR